MLEEARYPQRREQLDLEEANISLELAYQRIEEMDLELEEARQRERDAAAAPAAASGSVREDDRHDRTRSRGMSVTDRTDYWSYRSGRSMSRARGKGR